MDLKQMLFLEAANEIKTIIYRCARECDKGINYLLAPKQAGFLYHYDYYSQQQMEANLMQSSSLYIDHKSSDHLVLNLTNYLTNRFGQTGDINTAMAGGINANPHWQP